MRNAAENFSVRRRIALTLLSQDKTRKVDINTRRLLAASNDAYRLNLLSTQGVAACDCPGQPPRTVCPVIDHL
jgi:hypothetical protein